jgi:hypothetical protein
MDRHIVYPGQIPLETDQLHANKDAMVGLAMACQAVLGTATVVDGLVCAPTTPASLSVTIGQGSLYSQAMADSSAYSSLASDSTIIVKQGLQLAPATLTLTPPGTVGYATNYLIEVAYLDQDGGSTVLPYYNASNPSQAYSGPNNSGAAQNVVRQGLISIQAKAGVAATAGTQATPAVDAGYTALYVVTVAYGATAITGGNIVTVTGAPFITPKLPAVPAAIQAQSGNYAADTGAANAYAVTLTPAPAALTAGMPVRFRVANANTGASTLNVNGLGAVSILRPDGVSALIAGDLVAGSVAEVRYSGTNWQLVAMASAASNHHTWTTITSGSGTYAPPAGVKWLLVRLVGGGGGGAAAGVSPSPGGLGGTTIFGTSFLTAPGGGSNGQQGGYGAYSSNPPYPTIQGGDGANGSGTAATSYQAGGNGGSSPLGVGGVGGIIGSVAPRIGNGWGGGGGGGSVGATAGVSGGGGGAGAYVEAVITSLAASYSYAVGSGGLGGTNSGYQSGASGAPGVIIIYEYY